MRPRRRGVQSLQRARRSGTIVYGRALAVQQSEPPRGCGVMRRVLICEDEPLLAADLALIVEEAGHAVCGVFPNARDALNNVGELNPDLAIIDLNLADGDTGAAVAHTLQSLGIRVIILSGNSNVGAGLGLVPHTFASKPVSKEVMVQLLGPGEHAATKTGPSLSIA